MLRHMDGDIFGAVSRLGRDAAEGLVRAVHGDAWDPFLATRCMDVLVANADGIPSLPSVLEVLRDLQGSPLLAATLVEASVDRIADAVRQARGTLLDLMLRSVAERSILRGQYDPRAVLERFCAELLDRSIISGRGGFLELPDGGQAHRHEAMAIVAPVAARAAERLEARPDAKRLGLSRQHAHLVPESDLLGGGS
jgi:hypothetical protein